MMFKMKKIFSLLMMIALSAACLTGQDVGEDAPEFSYQSLSGDTVKLSDYRGKVVFLFLFGNGCPSCKIIGNDTETKVQKVYGERDDFQALGLDLWNSTSSVTTVTAFKSTTGISYPLLLQAGEMEEKYQTTYDRLLVIDREGKIRHKGTTVVSNDLDTAVAVIEGLYATTGTADLSGTGSPVLGIHPNPVEGEASIHLSLAQRAQVDHRIYSLTGREIMNLGAGTYPAGKHVWPVPAGDLPAGVYLLRSMISGKAYIRRMVVN
jgi:peroxiredoxin